MAKKIALLPVFLSLFSSSLIVPGSLLVAYLSTKESYQGKLLDLLAMKSPIMPIEAMIVLVQSKTIWIISIFLSMTIVYYYSSQKKEGIK